MATQTEQQTTTTSQTDSPLDTVVQETMQKRAHVKARAAAQLGVAPEHVCNLLRNHWRTSKGQPPLTDVEMFQGLSLIAHYELDPMAREIYVTRDKQGRLLTIVSIDGWIKVLDRTDHYDGHEQKWHHTAEGEVDWIETMIFSKKRSHPTTYRALMKEYAAVAGYVYSKMPTHMLRLFSLRHAARQFTPLGGNVVTEDEAGIMLSASESEIDTDATPPPSSDIEPTPAEAGAQSILDDYENSLDLAEDIAQVNKIADQVNVDERLSPDQKGVVIGYITKKQEALREAKREQKTLVE